ncbi:MAG TPA: hypothetical protein VMW52_01575 [Phycisphaerae bacterium]|nr:hypothetical protein [Phycisphaerae bacterium]
MLPTDFSTDHPLPTAHCPLPIRLFDPDGRATAAAGYTLASLYRRLVRPALLARQASPRYVLEVDR